MLQYFLGSVVWTLVHESGLAGNFESRAERIWELYVEGCKSCGVGQGVRLAREDFFVTFGDQTGPNPKTFPTLHGKAAKIHNALKPLHMACKQIHREQKLGNDEHQHRLAAIKTMVEFYDVLRQASHVLTDDEYDRCDRAATRFLLHQNALAMI